ncbi:hypothetical protein FNH22_07175 [Fulvivirga sp. M361]|uniref:hypothetical protein n=1 Tax=Fulvivirga sp. M361 TaxID=2594266 RepID=UPI00117AF140|nr:hypothetical protein [Fulvivirga sp. M361]TRX60815.1 hypothetical protein FNH22_07175 [Fulvivirga sp. M361]
MTINSELSEEEIKSIKASFFNILALFLNNENIQSRYVGCLMKWSAQLNLSQQDLHNIEDNFDQLEFTSPGTKLEKLQSIYHLVHMIYLDNVVEDIELEVATLYAERLGFKTNVVSELFKAIATAPFDGKKTSDVENEIAEFLELYID